jgi:hypothetical protein
MYMSSPNRDRVHRSRTSSRKILVLMLLSFLSITITILVFPPFDYVQVPLAQDMLDMLKKQQLVPDDSTLDEYSFLFF